MATKRRSINIGFSAIIYHVRVIRPAVDEGVTVTALKPCQKNCR